MLPPIPQSILPHGVQLDPAKHKPDVPPVTPAQESAKGEGVKLKDRPDPDDGSQYRPRKRKAREDDDELADEEPALSDEPLPRKGLWVDIEV